MNPAVALLDANVLIDARKAGLLERLVEANARSPWRLTQEVSDELADAGACPTPAWRAVTPSTSVTAAAGGSGGLLRPATSGS